MANELAVRLGIVKEKPETEPKTHKHNYRKDGTCACGAIRKAKR